MWQGSGSQSCEKCKQEEKSAIVIKVIRIISHRLADDLQQADLLKVSTVKLQLTELKLN